MPLFTSRRANANMKPLPMQWKQELGGIGRRSRHLGFRQLLAQPLHCVTPRSQLPLVSGKTHDGTGYIGRG